MNLGLSNAHSVEASEDGVVSCSLWFQKLFCLLFFEFEENICLAECSSQRILYGLQLCQCIVGR